jgi:hypothetical protein
MCGLSFRLIDARIRNVALVMSHLLRVKLTGLSSDTARLIATKAKPQITLTSTKRIKPTFVVLVLI